MDDPATARVWEDCLRCDLCGGEQQHLLFAIRPRSDGQAGGIVRCGACGLVYRNVRPSIKADLGGYEEKDYSDPAPGWIEGRKAVFAGQVEALAPFRRLNRVLDIGAGHGFFLAACRDHGWQGQGIELAAQPVEFARRQLGVEMVQAPLEQAELPAAHYDAVTLWNVLDQLRSPRQVLSQVQRLLRAGGVVVVRLPNAAFHVPARRLFAAVGRSSPTVFHLYSFDLLRLRRLLEQTGFTQVQGSVAHLSWTTAYDAQPGVAKRVLSGAAQGVAQAVRLLTGGRALWSPSIVVTACKPGGDPSVKQTL